MRSATITVLVVSSPAQKSGTLSGCFRTAALRRGAERERIRGPLAQRHVDIVLAGRHGEPARDADRLSRGRGEIDGKDDVERIPDEPAAAAGGRRDVAPRGPHVHQQAGGGERRPVDDERERDERAVLRLQEIVAPLDREVRGRLAVHRRVRQVDERLAFLAPRLLEPLLEAPLRLALNADSCSGNASTRRRPCRRASTPRRPFAASTAPGLFSTRTAVMSGACT